MDNGLETADLRLAQRLADLRQQQGWSLEELAQRTGLSRATLSRVERAETSPTASLLNRLCAAYGLNMSRLLSEIEDEPPMPARRLITTCRRYRRWSITSGCCPGSWN